MTWESFLAACAQDGKPLLNTVNFHHPEENSETSRFFFQSPMPKSSRPQTLNSQISKMDIDAPIKISDHQKIGSPKKRQRTEVHFEEPNPKKRRRNSIEHPRVVVLQGSAKRLDKRQNIVITPPRKVNTPRREDAGLLSPQYTKPKKLVFNIDDVD